MRTRIAIISSSFLRRTGAALALLLLLTSGVHAAEKLKALIVDGQNNHEVWPKSTIMMKQYLEDTGLFEVDVARTRFSGSAEREKDFLPLAGVGESERLKEPKPDPDFKPDFAQIRRGDQQLRLEGRRLAGRRPARRSRSTWPRAADSCRCMRPTTVGRPGRSSTR